MLVSLADSIKIIQWLTQVIWSSCVTDFHFYQHEVKKNDQKTLICPCHHATWQPSHHSSQMRNHSGTWMHVSSETSRPCTPSGTTVVPGKCIIDKRISHQMGISDKPVLFYDFVCTWTCWEVFLSQSDPLCLCCKKACTFVQHISVHSLSCYFIFLVPDRKKN